MARGICVFFGKMRRPLPWRKQQEGDWWSAGAELGVVHEGRMHARGCPQRHWQACTGHWEVEDVVDGCDSGDRDVASSWVMARPTLAQPPGRSKEMDI